MQRLDADWFSGDFVRVCLVVVQMVDYAAAIG